MLQIERVLDMKIKTMIGAVFLFLATGAVGGFVGVSVVPERAPIVGTLNLRILIDSLDERKALERRLDDIESAVQIELANRRTRIDELDADLEDYVSGSAKFEEARNAWGLEAMKYEAFREYSEAKRQYETNDMKIYADSNFAGCKATRKSTSGGCVMIGRHCIRGWT